MNIYEFMSDSPILSIFLVWIILIIITILFFSLPTMIMRHINIHKHGYPPQHCDADGDFKKINNKKEM